MTAAPRPRAQSLHLELPDTDATGALARRIAAIARCGDVIALAGDLGSGKTCFARAFINALPGGPESEEVPSPTFTLVQRYDRAPAEVWHFDLYRLNRPEEAFELGIEEAFVEGVTLIEWPERLGPLLPAERLEVAFSFAAAADVDSRGATLTGYGAWAERLCGVELAESDAGEGRVDD